MQTAEHIGKSKKRGWIFTVLFAVCALASTYQFAVTNALGFLLAALGFALSMPKAFFLPVTWRDPFDFAKRNAPSNRLWRSLSAIGLILVIASLAFSLG